MWNSRPRLPPLHGENHLKFPFWLFDSFPNVSFCVPILGTKNVTCLSDGTALRGFQKEHSLIHFLRGLAAPVIWKVRVLCYEFTDVTLAWEDGQWVEAHKIILAGCSPNKSTPALMFELNGSYSDVQKTKTKTANRSRFWLPKVGTLDETIEKRCQGGGWSNVNCTNVM